MSIAALGAAERDAGDRRLPAHQRGERPDLVEVDLRVVADAALVGAARAVVLDAEAAVHAYRAVVHAEGDLDLHLAVGGAQHRPDVVAQFEVVGGDVEPVVDQVDRGDLSGHRPEAISPRRGLRGDPPVRRARVDRRRRRRICPVCPPAPTASWCILLDAFGSVFLERFGDHPLLRDISVCPLPSQFPSTTAAHITTMHTGLPVLEHGIYEWNVYEPSLDRVITPLRFSFAGDRDGDTLRAAGVDPRDLVPADPCLYERLAAQGVVSLVYQPDAFSPSTYDSAVIRAADIRPYRDLADGLDRRAALRQRARARLRLRLLPRHRPDRSRQRPVLGRLRRGRPLRARRGRGRARRRPPA